jgi:hypothetical protein
MDEVIAMARFARAPVGVILTSFADPSRHVFSALVAHARICTFGEQAWALRLPALAPFP